MRKVLILAILFLFVLVGVRSGVWSDDEKMIPKDKDKGGGRPLPDPGGPMAEYHIGYPQGPFLGGGYFVGGFTPAVSTPDTCVCSGTPSISNVSHSGGDEDTAEITWKTATGSEPDSIRWRMNYAGPPWDGQVKLSETDCEDDTSHTHLITGLDSQANDYYFSMYAECNGNGGWNSNDTFRTCHPTFTTANPDGDWNMLQDNFVTADITCDQSETWRARVRYQPSAIPGWTTTGWTAHRTDVYVVGITGLTPSTQYDIQIQLMTRCGNEGAWSGTFNETTDGSGHWTTP